MTHPDDGVLLRHLDMELEGCESDEVTEHLTRCRSCNERLIEIQNTMSIVANALSRTDLTSGTRRQVSLPRMFAVAASILLAVTAYFTPLRAWVLERAQQMWNVGDEAEISYASLPPEPSVSEPTSATVSFEPTSEVFALELSSRQMGGALTVSIGNGGMATATISGELVDESLLVLPGRLRIVNSAASTTTYAVVLPPTVSRIEVIVASEDTVVLRPSLEQQLWTVPVQLQ